jgi:AcrR family transcriptional regulator
MTAAKQNYHHGDVPQALMDAALSRIKQDGVEKLSLRAIARDIGVSQSAPYRHFKDKNALLAQLACDGFYQLANCKEKSELGENPLENLITIGLAYFDYAVNHPQHYMLMFGSKIEQRHEQDGLKEAGEAAFGVICAEIQNGVDSGLLIAHDPYILAKSFWAKLHGLSSLAIDGFFDKIGEDSGEAEFAAFLQTQIKLSIRGLALNPQNVEIESA